MPDWVGELMKGGMPLLGVMIGGAVTYFVQAKLAGTKQQQDRQTNAALLTAVLREYQATCAYGFHEARYHNEQHMEPSYYRPKLSPPLATDDLKNRAAFLPPDVAQLVLELHVRAIDDDRMLDGIEEVEPEDMRDAVPKRFAELVIEVDKVVRRLRELAGWPVLKREEHDDLWWVQTYLAEQKEKERKANINLD